MDVVARLLARLGAKLFGARLGGLEDLLDPGRRRRRDGLPAAAAQALELVRDPAEVGVDGVGLVAATHGREVGALDG